MSESDSWADSVFEKHERIRCDHRNCEVIITYYPSGNVEKYCEERDWYCEKAAECPVKPDATWQDTGDEDTTVS
jgi:hypothetical protein